MRWSIWCFNGDELKLCSCKRKYYKPFSLIYIYIYIFIYSSHSLSSSNHDAGNSQLTNTSVIEFDTNNRQHLRNNTRCSCVRREEINMITSLQNNNAQRKAKPGHGTPSAHIRLASNLQWSIRSHSDLLDLVQIWGIWFSWFRTFSTLPYMLSSKQTLHHEHLLSF